MLLRLNNDFKWILTDHISSEEDVCPQIQIPNLEAKAKFLPLSKQDGRYVACIIIAMRKVVYPDS